MAIGRGWPYNRPFHRTVCWNFKTYGDVTLIHVTGIHGQLKLDPAALTVSIEGEETNVNVLYRHARHEQCRPVNAAVMSMNAGADVHVLGDASQQGDMPKPGFAANSQAKVRANVLRGALIGSKVLPAKFSMTFLSLIDTNDGVNVGATEEESEGWYEGITADIFAAKGLS